MLPLSAQPGGALFRRRERCRASDCPASPSRPSGSVGADAGFQQQPARHRRRPRGLLHPLAVSR